MIVDLYTRIWASQDQLGHGVAEQARRRRRVPWEQITASAEEHAAAMGPIDHAVILGFESAKLGASIDAAEVAGHVQRDPHKFLGFVGIDPTIGKPVKRLDQALEMGLVGVTISPAAQGIHPTDTRAMALYEACEQRGVPVHFDTANTIARDACLEFSEPAKLDEVARTFPDLKMVIASVGEPWVEQCIALMSKHPTVFGDLSSLAARPWQLYTTLVMAHQRDAIGQVLFGSGFPFCKPQDAVMAVYSASSIGQGTHLPSIPREQLRQIVERDTLGVLGLPIPAGHAAQNESTSISTNPSAQPEAGPA